MGTLARVVTVDTTTGDTTLVFQNGNGCEIQLDGDLSKVQAGTTLYLSDTSWGISEDPSAFKEPVMIAIIGEVRDTGLLVEGGGLGLSWIPYQGGISVAAGNTIKYFQLSGHIEVISETPLRGGALFDSEIDMSHFKRDSDPANLPSFADFGGARDEVAEVRNLLDLQSREKGLLSRLKVKPIRGVLFSGPPGTGKTMLARIIAAETDSAFYVVNGPQIINKWVGSSEKLLRAIFASAEAEPKGAIIFFDEIDSLVSSREQEASETGSRLIGELLTQLDGFDRSSNVIVIAATNSVDSLDPALRRPGRFDRQLNFDLPSADERLDILWRTGANRPWNDDLPLEQIAIETEAFSPADLESIWDEAGRLAANERRESISTEDVLMGVDAVHKQRLRRQRKEAR